MSGKQWRACYSEGRGAFKFVFLCSLDFMSMYYLYNNYFIFYLYDFVFIPPALNENPLCARHSEKHWIHKFWRKIRAKYYTKANAFLLTIETLYMSKNISV